MHSDGIRIFMILIPRSPKSRHSQGNRCQDFFAKIDTQQIPQDINILKWTSRTVLDMGLNIWSLYSRPNEYVKVQLLMKVLKEAH